MIRDATAADLDRLIELGQAMHDESPIYSTMPFDGEVLRRTLTYVIEHGFLCVHEINGHIDAGMVALVSPSWFGAGKTAADLAVFVEPAARGGTAAYRLVERFNRWADENGVHMQYLGTTTKVNPYKSARLYAHLGFDPVGDLFIRKGNHVHGH